MSPRLRQLRRSAGRAVRLFLSIALVAAGGCHATDRERAGAVMITRQACGSCHTIPGIQQADGSVGPPLTHFASQQMIAGALPNTPRNLARFLKAPRMVVKGSVMPDQPLTDDQLRDVVAYLDTLK